MSGRDAMARVRNRTYKRTWKNLLINKRYQLRFTLFMVVLSALLMSLLGWWVMTVADRATTLAVNNVLTACQDLPGGRASAAPIAPPPAAAPPAAAAVEESAPASAAPPGRKRARRRPVVTIDDSGMKDMPPPPSPASAQAPGRATGRDVTSSDRCRAALPGKVAGLEARQRLIFWLLVGVGALVTIALLLYGIKMTHRVAGPLYKVTLYMGKLRKGVYDVVYSLRKGDQLVEFYEHFKAGHAGMRGLQEEDVARLRSLIAAAEKADLAARSPELAEALDELRAVVERKEASLG